MLSKTVWGPDVRSPFRAVLLCWVGCRNAWPFSFQNPTDTVCRKNAPNTTTSPGSWQRRGQHSARPDALDCCTGLPRRCHCSSPRQGRDARHCQRQGKRTRSIVSMFTGKTRSDAPPGASGRAHSLYFEIAMLSARAQASGICRCFLSVCVRPLPLVQDGCTAWACALLRRQQHRRDLAARPSSVWGPSRPSLEPCFSLLSLSSSLLSLSSLFSLLRGGQLDGRLCESGAQGRSDWSAGGDALRPGEVQPP